MFVMHKCECGVCIYMCMWEKTHIHLLETKRRSWMSNSTPHLILFEVGSLVEVGTRLAASELRYPPLPTLSLKVWGLIGRGITTPGFLCG